jgi:phytanoyl-CoA hydroxylase
MQAPRVDGELDALTGGSGRARVERADDRRAPRLLIRAEILRHDLALDDATIANGCLWYLPGTHHTARFELTEIGPNVGALFDQYPEWLEIEPVAMPCAGGAVFHNGLVAHAAGANMTPRPRRAMTCAFMPVGSTFNGTQNILTDDYVSRLEIGDVLDDDTVNPLVWPA